ncbi:MAG: FtsX-like permease family protein [Fibrobacteria bacterium]
MGLILKMAWRNLFRHRGQSLVIGTILFLGAFLMTLGNGVITGMDRGLRNTVVNGFTGDLILVPERQESDNVFLQMMGRGIQPLYGFPAIDSVLRGIPYVARYLPIGKNMAMVLNEDEGNATPLYLLGVDFARYAKMFPGSLALKDGRFPRPGMPGLLLPTGGRKGIHDRANTWFVPASRDSSIGAVGAGAGAETQRDTVPKDAIVRSSMVMLGFNEDNSTTDIRLDVDGIFRFRSLNTIFGNFALVDIESYRQCLGYFQASERTQGRMSGRDSALFSLGEEDLDAQFGMQSELAPAVSPVRKVRRVRKEKAPPLPDSTVTVESPVMQTPTTRGLAATADLDQGAYNLVLVLLEPGADAAKSMTDLNGRFQDAKIGVRAVGWKDSLGPIGSMATLIKGALFLFVSFLFVVAVIIIINTLTMAALERTPELGMMRAIGARKGFVSLMFLAETGLLSLFFGGLGIVSGAVTVEIVSLFKIASENDVLQLFFGGDTFRPALSAGDFLLGFTQLGLVALAAVLYPLRIARRVSPLDAVYKE